MIVIINGALGIGKSTVGEAIVDELGDAIFMDGDYYYVHSSINFRHPDYHCQWCDIIAHNIIYHLTQVKTSKNFVISYVFQTQEQLLQLITTIYKHFNKITTSNTSNNCNENIDPNPKIFTFLLTVTDNNILKKRIRKRNNGDLEWELDRGCELLQLLNKQHKMQPHSIGQVIDTTTRGVADIVDEIVNFVTKRYNIDYTINTINKRKLGKHDAYLSFLQQFEEITLKRKKCATTRLITDEPNGDYLIKMIKKCESGMGASDSDEYKSISDMNGGASGKKDVFLFANNIDQQENPFGIISINKIEKYTLKEIEMSDKIAKIENIQNGKDLRDVLEMIYIKQFNININDDTPFYVLYFTCVHYFNNWIHNGNQKGISVKGNETNNEKFAYLNKLVPFCIVLVIVAVALTNFLKF